MKKLSIALSAIAAGIVSAQQQQQWPVFERDGKAAVLSAIDNWVQNATNSFVGDRFPSPASWNDQVIYHILPDRFNDGDPSRNSLNLPPGQAADVANFNLFNINNFRQGGDLAGITNRLDYLVDLGITALWITPILKMDGSYHGYCTTDPTQIDPGFGSNEDFRTLVTEAHKRGIRVIMDIVINHVCDGNTFYRTPSPNHVDCAQSLWDASGSGTPSDGRNRGTLQFSSNFFGPYQNQFFFSRCGANFNDDTTSERPVAVFGDFTGSMFDFDTRNYDFHDIFFAIHRFWVAFADVDGFRLDAAKHVTEDFIADFSTRMRDYALSLGKQDFFLVGEVAASIPWQGRRLGNMYINPATLTTTPPTGVVPQSLINKVKILQPTFSRHPINRYPGLNAVYNFNLGGTMRTVLRRDGSTFQNSPARVGDFFSNDAPGINADGADFKNLWLPIEIHDWPRFIRNHLGDNPIGLAAIGTAFLMTMPGQPIIFYGFEQGFAGTCPSVNNIVAGNLNAFNHIVHDVCTHDGYDGEGQSMSRQSMFATAGWKMQTSVSNTNALAGIGPQQPSVDPKTYDWKQDKYLDRSNFMYVNTKRLIKLRQSCSVLRHGDTYVRVANDFGLLAYSRIFNGVEAVVLLNTKPDGDYNVPNGFVYVDAGVRPGTVFVDLLSTNVVATAQPSNSGMQLFFGGNGYDMAARGYAIFVPQSIVGSFDNDSQVTLCNN